MIWIIIVLPVLAAAIIARMRWENRHFQITEYKCADPRFAANGRPVKAVVLADLHNHEFGAGNEQLLKAIDEIAPDCIFVAGDLTVAVPGKPIEPAAALMEKLAPKYPIYYGVGNHEYRMRIYPETYGSSYGEYDARLQKAGVSMLHNERRTVMLGSVEADVYGLEMNRRYYKRLRKSKMERQYLDAVLPKPRECVFRILLAHSPDYFEAYAKWGADLTISGHVHGGIVRLFGRGLISPSTGLFPKYSGGRYEKDGKQMLVSHGLGGHTLPLRLFNVPELPVIIFTDQMEAAAQKRGHEYDYR